MIEDPSGVERFEPQGPGREPPASPEELAGEVQRIGAALGFARIGVAPAERLTAAATRLEHWLAEGLGDGLDYMPGERSDPGALLPGARSVVVGALAHGPFSPEPAEPGRGQVAAYARGDDYHLVLKQRLRDLGAALANAAGRPVRGRLAVDTAPLLERELGVRAGIGFLGKNTMLIAPGLGSGFLLGELVVDLPIAPAPQSVAPGCGACRACLDACPTDAFVDAHRLDARRCISFLTIEAPGDIPVERRSEIGSRAFGCDACQSVCPYNASASPRPAAPELDGRVPVGGIDLRSLLSMGNAGYRKLVKRSALRRVTRDVLARNAAVALARDTAAVEPLSRALAAHPHAGVRRHAAWALGELGSDAARAALASASKADPDPSVRDAAAAALAALDGKSASAYR
jgi:epoxyqueuosine reductase